MGDCIKTRRAEINQCMTDLMNFTNASPVDDCWCCPDLFLTAIAEGECVQAAFDGKFKFWVEALINTENDACTTNTAGSNIWSDYKGKCLTYDPFQAFCDRVHALVCNCPSSSSSSSSNSSSSSSSSESSSSSSAHSSSSSARNSFSSSSSSSESSSSSPTHSSSSSSSSSFSSTMPVVPCPADCTALADTLRVTLTNESWLIPDVCPVGFPRGDCEWMTTVTKVGSSCVWVNRIATGVTLKLSCSGSNWILECFAYNNPGKGQYYKITMPNTDGTPYGDYNTSYGGTEDNINCAAGLTAHIEPYVADPFTYPIEGTSVACQSCADQIANCDQYMQITLGGMPLRGNEFDGGYTCINASWALERTDCSGWWNGWVGTSGTSGIWVYCSGNIWTINWHSSPIWRAYHQAGEYCPPADPNRWWYVGPGGTSADNLCECAKTASLAFNFSATPFSDSASPDCTGPVSTTVPAGCPGEGTLVGPLSRGAGDVWTGSNGDISVTITPDNSSIGCDCLRGWTLDVSETTFCNDGGSEITADCDTLPATIALYGGGSASLSWSGSDIIATISGACCAGIYTLSGGGGWWSGYIGDCSVDLTCWDGQWDIMVSGISETSCQRVSAGRTLCPPATW